MLIVHFSGSAKSSQAGLQREGPQKRKSKTFPRSQDIELVVRCRPNIEPLVVESFLFAVCTVLCVLPPAVHANQSSSRQLGRTPKRPAVHHFPRLACPSSAASGSCRSLRRPDWTGEPTMHQASRNKSRCRPAEERRAWHPWLGAWARSPGPTPPDLARSCLFLIKVHYHARLVSDQAPGAAPPFLILYQVYLPCVFALHQRNT
ncbi:hypothetical protein F5144DRAFT_43710 [Chaetomium tenue]|uniref:Uncharacterized protein n=1 Tax=Chaetomium tenue TaxID=1854479 RepID=A0ACB7PQ05_9PEZI|nr:hypothetical protein F5144DRAFT_43710 [Chaetomium globosum]